MANSLPLTLQLRFSVSISVSVGRYHFLPVAPDQVKTGCVGSQSQHKPGFREHKKSFPLWLAMDTVTSTRDKNKLIHNGYVYVKQKILANGVVSYECELRKRGRDNSGQCKAKVKVLNGEVISHLNEHTHASVVGRTEMLQTRATMKERAVETMETPQQILATGLRHVSEVAAIQLPPVRVIRRAIRQTKQNAINPVPIPRQVADLYIPDKYQRTATGEQFLLYDSEEDDGPRMLIFATQQGLALLARSDHWFMDGTFKVVPEIFFQLYTIHSLCDSQVIPCVYSLLPNKQETTYNIVFQKLKDANADLEPETVLVDFEKAAINSTRASFPNAQVHGCLYHLAQCVHRRVQAAGLQERYNNDAQFALSARMLPALAFVPPDDVTESFELLQDQLPEELQPVVDSFEDTFIGRPGRRDRRQPLFSKQLWNCSTRVAAGLPRTNNNVEGWHRKMSASLGCHHPNIWLFLDALQKEHSLNRVTVRQILAGDAAPPQRRIYRETSQRLQNLVADYGNRPRVEFLRGVAHNIQF